MSFATNRFTVVPPIPLVKSAEKPEVKGDFFKTKIFPGGNNDANKAHDIAIRHFSSGTPEEWIMAYIAFMSIVEWKQSENLFTHARIFLKGDALKKFNKICMDSNIPFNDNEYETKDNFDLVTGKLSTLLMPRNSLHSQKEYMLHYCRKPVDMTMRTYVTRLCELNDYLAHFPPNFSEDQKFDDQQIIDIINFGMPPKWKLKLATDFGTVDQESITLEWLMDFGERQELQESYMTTNSTKGTITRTIPRKGPSTYKKEYIDGSLTKTGYASMQSKKDSQNTKKKWCAYHKTNSHDMNDCIVVKKLAESAAQSRDSKSSVSPAKFDKNEFKTFMMFRKWYDEKHPKMMMMEGEPEEPAVEETLDEEVTDEIIEEGEENDLDNLSLSDMQDME